MTHRLNQTTVKGQDRCSLPRVVNVDLLANPADAITSRRSNKHSRSNKRDTILIGSFLTSYNWFVYDDKAQACRCCGCCYRKFRHNSPTKHQKRQQRNATSEILAEPSTSSNAVCDQQPLKSLLLQINMRRQLGSRLIPSKQLIFFLNYYFLTIFYHRFGLIL